jgi:hypothetical protein
VNNLKAEMIEYIAQPLPNGLYIVPQSIPVLFFGDIEKANFATIAINPSRREFQKVNKELLTEKAAKPEDEKRFVDRETLGIADDKKLSAKQAENVYHSLLAYFGKNPYREWFDKVNEILPAGMSYDNGSVVHLDMTPWATDPVWSAIKRPDVKEKLIKAGNNWASKILEKGQIKCLFINGQSALDHVEKYLLGTGLEHKKVFTPEGKEQKINISYGYYKDCLFIAWNRAAKYTDTAALNVEVTGIYKECLKK